MGRRVELIRAGEYTVVGFGIGRHIIEWRDENGNYCHASDDHGDYSEFVAAVFDNLLRKKRQRRAKKR